LTDEVFIIQMISQIKDEVPMCRSFQQTAIWIMIYDYCIL